MRALSSCDFCGDDAAGTFEVVPDEFLQTATDQRRIALCEGCRTTLEDVLEPFLRGEADKQADAEAVAKTAATVENGSSRDDSDQSPTSAAVDSTARAEGIAIGRSEMADESDVDEADDEGVTLDDDDEQTNDVGDEPDQFRKVMRLLSNREFPVDRAEFAELTAGAYEMEDDHVARIIDHAVERGVLVDDDGTLNKA
ncbi:hypothetical protein [Halogranum rubrum]|uniref:Uncharacterized protein n=1 Tax=Halogranum salarium B-1 TaxID=1210908 RepID=J3EXS0_9EURY|nr:hypothetical protein [Halogranum salarium]EJN59987.1 hypothetical protein HSB1_21450 [Halogranum salarium B-1]